jgi:hypothetical protein
LSGESSPAFPSEVPAEDGDAHVAGMPSWATEKGPEAPAEKPKDMTVGGTSSECLECLSWSLNRTR